MEYCMAANWKMNTTLPETGEVIRSFLPMVKDIRDVDTVIAPSSTVLSAASDAIKGSAFKLSSQDVFWEEKGPLPGRSHLACFLMQDVIMLKTATDYHFKCRTII
jgi:triosephosphate isomerase